MSRRFIATLITILIIVAATGVAILYSKGYIFSLKTGTITGTGVLSVKTVPDQVSIYLDGHPYTATNNSVTNISSLAPKKYNLKISKEGFISWEKEVEIREGLITDVKVVLFRSTLSLYSVTGLGVEKAVSSADGQKIAYIVPLQNSQDPLTNKKSGIWVWQIGDKRGLPFGGTSDPRLVAQSTSGNDLSQADLEFSPDSQQLLVKLPNHYLLLETNKLNDPPTDITLTYQNTALAWKQQNQAQNNAKLQKIKNLDIRKEASFSAEVKWSPDDTKVIYCQNCSQTTVQTGSLASPQPSPNKDSALYKVYDVLTNKNYDLPKANSYTWLNESPHIVIAETEELTNDESVESSKKVRQLPFGKISVIDYDGSNKAEIFAGNFDPQAVFSWPDDSHIVIISSFQTATGAQPNLYGVNLR